MAEKLKQTAFKMEIDSLTYAWGDGDALRITLQDDVLAGLDEPGADVTKAVLWAIMLDQRQLVNEQRQMNLVLTQFLQVVVQGAAQPVPVAVTAPAAPAEDATKQAMATAFEMMKEFFPEGSMPPGMSETLERLKVDHQVQPIGPVAPATNGQGEDAT